jgi:hypothetical protein
MDSILHLSTGNGTPLPAAGRPAVPSLGRDEDGPACSVGWWLMAGAGLF